MKEEPCWICGRTEEEAARDLERLKREASYEESEGEKYYVQIASQLVLMKKGRATEGSPPQIDEEEYWLKIPLCQVCSGLFFALDYHLTQEIDLTLRAELAGRKKRGPGT
jgi:hypothetical protein